MPTVRDINQSRESLESRDRSFFSIPGNEFLDFRESRIETDATARQQRDNCHRSLRACYQLSVNRLLLHGGCGPHTRRTDADAAIQRAVAYLADVSAAGR